jgi:tetratricopeptide (TPR) repeat protein
MASGETYVMNYATSSGESLRIVLDKQVLGTSDLLIAGDAAAERDDHARALALYDQLLSQIGGGEFSVGSAGSAVPGAETLLAIGLARKARELRTLGRLDEALGVIDELLRRLGESSDSAIRLQVADALWERKLAFVALGRRDLAIAACDELIERYLDANETFLVSDAAGAMVEKAFNIELLGRLDEAGTVYREVIARFGPAGDPQLRERVAKSRINAANLLAISRSTGELRSAVESEFDPEEVTLSARALVAQADTLLDEDSPDSALECVDAVLDALDDTDKNEQRKVVALALATKSVALMRLGESEDDAMLPFEIMVSAYGTEALEAFSEEATRLRSAVAPHHLKRLSWLLLTRVMILEALGRTSEAQAAGNEILERFDGNTLPAITQTLEATRQALADLADAGTA